MSIQGFDCLLKHAKTDIFEKNNIRITFYWYWSIFLDDRNELESSMYINDSLLEFLYVELLVFSLGINLVDYAMELLYYQKEMSLLE